MSEPAMASCPDPTTREVRRFYERYRFPGIRPLDQDGLVLMRHLKRRLSEMNRPVPRILDAGCGTGNTAIALAGWFPEATLLGIDLSVPSLERAREAAGGIENLRFRPWNLMDEGLDEEPFDVVLCLGVLHHTADMDRVLRHLVALLQPHGLLYLWVYGAHGRHRHTLNRRALALLMEASEPGEDPIDIARAFVLQAARGEVLDDLVGGHAPSAVRRGVLEEEAWLADQFLHPCERCLDLGEVLSLADRAGLALDEWLGVRLDPLHHLGAPHLVRRFLRLDERARLGVLDLLVKPDRYFLAFRPAPRPEEARR